MRKGVEKGRYWDAVYFMIFVGEMVRSKKLKL